MSAWEHPSRDLFRAGQGAMAPTTADRERVRARLAAKLGAAAVGAAITTTSATAGGATAAAATGSAKGGLAVFIAKIAIPLLLVGGAAGFVVPHLAKKEAPPVAPVVVAPHAPAPVPPPPLPRETATVSVTDLPAAAPVPSASAPARAAKTAASDPVEEARIVAAIDDALRANDTTRALRLADEHAQKFPNGVLVEEREGARAIARCMKGSHASADVFLAAHPRSPMRARIVSACGRKSER